jgi:hypothetical protein
LWEKTPKSGHGGPAAPVGRDLQSAENVDDLIAGDDRK